MLTGFSVFVVLILLLLISWSLVTFWQRFLENFFYGTLGYNPDITLNSLWVAILSTGIFFLIVWLIKYLEIIPNVDILIFDYNEEVNIGGNIEALRSRGPRRITGRISPRGALFIS
jgi:hypothetical protein